MCIVGGNTFRFTLNSLPPKTFLETRLVFPKHLVPFAKKIAKGNGLVGKRNKVRNQWSQMEVQLKRRFDLIPNLVQSVKGYAAHES